MGENFLFGFESIPYEFLRILHQLKIHRGTVCYTSSYTALDLFFYRIYVELDLAWDVTSMFRNKNEIMCAPDPLKKSLINFEHSELS
jgi:hypothetical protein